LGPCLPTHGSPDEKRTEVSSQPDDEEEHDWAELGFSLFGPLPRKAASLGIGWVVHTFLV